MAKIIKFPLRAEENHGGASEGQQPPNAKKAGLTERCPVIELHLLTDEELEKRLDEVDDGASLGHVLLTSDEELDKLLGKRRPKRRSKRRSSRPQRASGTS